MSGAAGNHHRRPSYHVAGSAAGVVPPPVRDPSTITPMTADCSPGGGWSVMVRSALPRRLPWAAVAPPDGPSTPPRDPSAPRRSGENVLNGGEEALPAKFASVGLQQFILRWPPRSSCTVVPYPGPSTPNRPAPDDLITVWWTVGGERRWRTMESVDQAMAMRCPPDRVWR